MSLAAHAVVLSAAVAAARPVPEEPAVRTLITWHPPPYPTPPTSPPQRTGGESGSGGTESTIPARCSFPDCELVTFDVPDSVALPADGIHISREEWERGTRAGGTGDSASVLGRDVVDREAVPLPTNPVPRYPEALRSAGIEGSVSARFVVDSTGHVIMESVIVDRSDHRLFADAVIEALRRARFRPAELRGRKVPQLVVQPFVFVIRE